MFSRRRYSRSYKRRLWRRALTVVVLMVLTALLLTMALQCHQSSETPQTETLPDAGSGD